ncbi:uncharacterized protein KQ657_000165 [Scheffersomyces spartinae]|uniref:Oxysterol-binding protein n=1 Tax=Scheffersomyces spartinae TaxID=45513 RepID=A0A9P7VDH8_9ASCO|nr:uncharacterized protein KQ657_000165 [Scheffersomyces spartinae]KAG7196153.1 hypothetical protein KQ657_000165 [Scheffersomyces spartinae]
MGLVSKLDKLKIKSSDSDKEPSMKFSQLKPEMVTGNEKNENTDDIDEVDNEGSSIIRAIIAQLKPGCDLTRITLPTFILEKKSMLERITNFFQIPDIMLQANNTEDPLERFLLITKWYLASWHIAPKAVKKPLNPVLGEIFACYWDDMPDGSSAYYLAEQTSHHPPKSSYFYLSPENKIRVDGILIPKSKFLGNSSAAMMEGWAHVTLGRWSNETYIMNQPNVYARGILFGKLRYELGDHMIIKCPDSGYEADIEFKTKGYISGTYDAIEGKIRKIGSPDTLFTITGKWNDVMEIKNHKTGKITTFYDTNNSLTHKPKVRPEDEQAHNESRKLWGPTIKALARRNHTEATDEKFKVEDEQRSLAKKRIEDGVEFHPKFFQPITLSDTTNEELEYIIYKKFDLDNDPETLKNRLFEVMAFLPGQTHDEKFAIPAYKKVNH